MSGFVPPGTDRESDRRRAQAEAEVEGHDIDDMLEAISAYRRRAGRRDLGEELADELMRAAGTTKRRGDQAPRPARCDPGGAQSGAAVGWTSLPLRPGQTPQAAGLTQLLPSWLSSCSRSRRSPDRGSSTLRATNPATCRPRVWPASSS
jgi:hypothetical protein